MSHRNVVPQPRDIAILRELSESRAVTVRHLAVVYFNSSTGAAYKRLQALRKNGWIGSLRTPAGYEDILQLTRQGYRLLSLCERPRYSWPQVQRRQQVSSSVLRHELAIMDVKTSLAKTSETLLRFSTFNPDKMFITPSGRGGRAIPLPTPDAYIQATDGDQKNHFFLELDTGSQRHQIITQKIRAYRQVKCLDPDASKPESSRVLSTVPFRVLFVCLSARRCDELCTCLQTMHPPVRSFVIVTILSDLGCGMLTQETERRHRSSQGK